MNVEYYIFAGFVGLMLFALIFWFKKTPRATPPRKEAEELAEKEGKLFRLYQNLEDMMDSFEAYVEQQTSGIGKQMSAMMQAEQRVDELAGRIEPAVRKAQDNYEQASAALAKAEVLATELSEKLESKQAELEERQRQFEQRLAEQPVIVERPAMQQAEAMQTLPEQQALPVVANAEAKQRRKLEPIVARPVEEQMPVYEPSIEIETLQSTQPVDTELPFTPIAAKPVVIKAVPAAEATQAGQLQTEPLQAVEPVQAVQPVEPVQSVTSSQAQAQLVRKIAEAKKNRQLQKQDGEAVAEVVARPVEPAQVPKFEAALPEYDIRSEKLSLASGEGKYQTYTRPAPIKQAAGKAEITPMEGDGEQSRKQQVIDLHNDGLSAEEISRQLGVAKGAISFILDLQGKLQ